jgi:hypothetical protein
MSDEGTSQASGDDLSGLSGFFFYVFIVHPATAWILKPGRFERKKSIMYAIGFLALLAAAKTGKFFVAAPCSIDVCLAFAGLWIKQVMSFTYCPMIKLRLMVRASLYSRNQANCSSVFILSLIDTIQAWKCKQRDQTTIPS